MSGRPLEASPAYSGPFRHAGHPRDTHQSLLLAWALSVTAHLLVLLMVLLRPDAGPARPYAASQPIMVSLVKLPQFEALKVIPSSPNSALKLMPSAAVLHRSTKPRLDGSFRNTGRVDGAVGDGGSQVECNTTQVVQRALQRDSLVRAAVEDVHRLGRTIVLWNGDWVRVGGQEGKGLSAVREAIMLEVAFAPERCQDEWLHGQVQLSLTDGGTRFVLGSHDWRWSDLLDVRSVRPDR
jgi:hypothetical protein